MGTYEPRHEIICFGICEVICAVPRCKSTPSLFRYIDRIYSTPKSEISNYLFLLNSPTFVEFVGYPSQVSQDMAHLITVLFNNMIFQSFRHHSLATRMYIDVLLTG